MMHANYRSSGFCIFAANTHWPSWFSFPVNRVGLGTYRVICSVCSIFFKSAEHINDTVKVEHAISNVSTYSISLLSAFLGESVVYCVSDLSRSARTKLAMPQSVRQIRADLLQPACLR